MMKPSENFQFQYNKSATYPKFLYYCISIPCSYSKLIPFLLRNFCWAKCCQCTEFITSTNWTAKTLSYYVISVALCHKCHLHCNYNFSTVTSEIANLFYSCNRDLCMGCEICRYGINYVVYINTYFLHVSHMCVHSNEITTHE